MSVFGNDYPCHYMIHTQHDCPSQMNSNLLISVTKLTRYRSLICCCQSTNFRSFVRDNHAWSMLKYKETSSQCCVKRVWEQHSLQGLRGETKIPCLISQRLTHKATQLLNALWHANRKSQYRGCRPRDWTYCLHISEHCDRKQEISLNHNHNMTC